MFGVLHGDQRARQIGRLEACEFLAQIRVATVVRGQLEALGARLRVQALAQRQGAVGDEPEGGCVVRIDGEGGAQVLVELDGERL